MTAPLSFTQRRAHYLAWIRRVIMHVNSCASCGKLTPELCSAGRALVERAYMCAKDGTPMELSTLTRVFAEAYGRAKPLNAHELTRLCEAYLASVREISTEDDDDASTANSTAPTHEVTAEWCVDVWNDATHAAPHYAPPSLNLLLFARRVLARFGSA